MSNGFGKVVLHVSDYSEGDHGQAVVIGVVAVNDDVGGAGLGGGERDKVGGADTQGGTKGQGEVAGFSCDVGTVEVVLTQTLAETNSSGL